MTKDENAKRFARGLEAFAYAAGFSEKDLTDARATAHLEFEARTKALELAEPRPVSYGEQRKALIDEMVDYAGKRLSLTESEPLTIRERALLTGLLDAILVGRDEP